MYIYMLERSGERSVRGVRGVRGSRAVYQEHLVGALAERRVVRRVLRSLMRELRVELTHVRLITLTTTAVRICRETLTGHQST